MNLRRLLIVLGIVGLTVLILNGFGSLHKVVEAFEHVKWYVLPLVIAIQLGSYYSNARYYQTFFNIFGTRVPLRRLYEAALGINFANQALPSGGVSGTTYLAEALKPYHVPPGKATLAQLGRYGFTFVTFFAVLGLGFLLLFFTGDLNKISARLVLLIMIIILALGLVLLLIFSERRRLEAFLKPPLKSVNFLGRTVFRRHSPVLPPTLVDQFLTEFYHGYHEIISHKRRWPSLLWWSLGGNIAEVATVYAVFVGFGQWVNPGIVITGYALAIAVGAAGFLIGGLGVYEAGMIGTFSALGVPFALSFSVVIVYRVLNLGLFLPPGLRYYRAHLKEAA
jgi:uncharacterized protein (TIRG00374 family)